MPKWLTDVLVQYPILVVTGLYFWYATRRLERQHERELQRAEALYSRNQADARRSHDDHLVSAERELAGLRDDLRQEVRAVGRKVDTLARKLG